MRLDGELPAQDACWDLARAAYHPTPQLANSLCGPNSAGFPQICAIFQRDNLRRHFWVRVLLYRGGLVSSAFRLLRRSDVGSHSQVLASLRDRHLGPPMMGSGGCGGPIYRGVLAIRLTAGIRTRNGLASSIVLRGHRSTRRRNSRFSCFYCAQLAVRYMSVTSVHWRHGRSCLLGRAERSSPKAARRCAAGAGLDGERAHRAIARRYQFALSQVFTKILWPAIFPQGTYKVQCHCPSCRAQSRRPEGRIISAEFVPVVLSRRDASHVGCRCDADQI